MKSRTPTATALCLFGTVVLACLVLSGSGADSQTSENDALNPASQQTFEHVWHIAHAAAGDVISGITDDHRRRCGS